MSSLKYHSCICAEKTRLAWWRTALLLHSQAPPMQREARRPPVRWPINQPIHVHHPSLHRSDCLGSILLAAAHASAGWRLCSLFICTGLPLKFTAHHSPLLLVVYVAVLCGRPPVGVVAAGVVARALACHGGPLGLAGGLGLRQLPHAAPAAGAAQLPRRWQLCRSDHRCQHALAAHAFQGT